MSSCSSEAAEQVVRMSLNGVEIAARITGKATERLAVLLYAILKDQKKTRGKTRLTNMLKSGHELKVFAVRDQDLVKFCEEAKKYGVLYCILKDTKAEDGLTDIMVKAEDAGKINRIFERFGLALAEMGSVKTAIEQKKEVPMDTRSGNGDVSEMVQKEGESLEEFMDRITEVNETSEEKTQNPTMARTGKSRLSEPSYGNRERRSEDVAEKNASRRPSVRKAMEEIRAEQGQKTKEQVPVKKKKKEKGSRE